MKRNKSRNLGCDVELKGLLGVKDAATLTKYGTILIVVGVPTYLLWRYGSFKFFKNFGKNVKAIAKAPKEFSIAEEDVIGNAVYQIDMIMNRIYQKEGNSAQYVNFKREWDSLKREAQGVEKKRVGFSEFYIKDKTKKEQMANRLSVFRKSVLNYLKKINTGKGVGHCYA